MTVGQILEEVGKAGLTLRLTGTGGINARPVDRITPALRDLLKAHKTDLVAALRQAEQDGLAIAKSPVSGATKTTETAKTHDKGVFVVSVAPSRGHFENFEGARQETQTGVVSPKSHRHGATKITETAKRSATPGDLWPRLEAIANKCCDHWQESAERRAEMLADLRAMTPDWQRHWIEHLEASYGKPK